MSAGHFCLDSMRGDGIMSPVCHWWARTALISRAFRARLRRSNNKIRSIDVADSVRSRMTGGFNEVRTRGCDRVADRDNILRLFEYSLSSRIGI